MKKIIKLLAVFFILFGFTSCDLFQQNSYEDPKEITQLKEEGRFIEISFQDMKEMCDDNESFIFFIKTFTCTQCSYYQDEIVKVLKEDTNKKIYCIVFEYLEVMELEEVKNIAYNVLGRDYYKVNEWEQGSVYVPLTFQVVNGKISNAFCGFMAAKNLRNMYSMNFFNLHYLSNIEDKFTQTESFTLHMSTVGGDEENTYLDALYDEYKNNPDKLQGYYFNLYKLDNDEKQKLLNLINSNYIGEKKDDEIVLNELPKKFELSVEQGKITGIKNLDEK